MHYKNKKPKCVNLIKVFEYIMRFTKIFIRNTIKRFFFKLVPKNRFGDKLIAYLDFVRFHKRLPNKKFLNDYLYQIKTSDEILNVLRQYTSDKELVKYYISSTVGNEFNVKTKKILRTREDVSGYKFSIGDVVKPTQASGLIMFIDTDKINRDAIASWLDLNFYDRTREANYKYLRPKIIVEEPIFGRTDVDDIKFFCYKGIVKVIQYDFDRRTNHTRMLYGRDWNSLNASLRYPKSDKIQDKPIKLDEMITVAEKLAKPFDLVRIDLFYDEKTTQFLVGEITHCHGSANETFDSKESEMRVSNMIFD